MLYQCQANTGAGEFQFGMQALKSSEQLKVISGAHVVAVMFLHLYPELSSAIHIAGSQMTSHILLDNNLGHVHPDAGSPVGATGGEIRIKYFGQFHPECRRNCRGYTALNARSHR